MVPPGLYKRRWIKLWIDECLTGTIREELEPEERGIWFDFLLLAGKNRPPGYISANETQAITPKRLAAILNVPITMLARAIKKFEESGRITIDHDTDIIQVVNWEKYQYSDYDRQKAGRQAKREEDPGDQANNAVIPGPGSTGDSPFKK